MKAVTITCVGCGMARKVKPSSPAAPVLTACEALEEKEGWTYAIGFFPMLTGDHQPRCAECSKAK